MVIFWNGFDLIGAGIAVLLIAYLAYLYWKDVRR